MTRTHEDDRAEHGLHAPRGAVADVAARRPLLRGAVQLAGFLVGVGLLAWAVAIALQEKNRASLEAVVSSEPGTVAWLLTVSASSVAVNGLMFWVVLRPLKRLNALDAVLTNAIAVFLSALPFKINLIVRVMIHHRRDGVAFKDIVSWLAAMTALALSVLVPVGLAGWWRGTIDAAWWAAALGGAALCAGVGVGLGFAALRWRVLSLLSLGADRIVRHVPTVAGHTVLRLGDVGLLCLRFMAAAHAAHIDLPPERTVLLATTYFLLSVFAPAGALGFREIGVAGVGVATGGDSSQVALVTLIVTAAEFLASGAMSVPAFFRLRPDRLWAARKAA